MDIVTLDHVDTSSFSGFSTATGSFDRMTTPTSSEPSSSEPSSSDVASSGPATYRAVPMSVLSDSSSDVQTILIGLQADRKLKEDSFVFTIANLVEKNCNVIVLSCLSVMYDEMGTPHRVDVESFLGLSKKKIEAGINEQMANLNHYLSSFRRQLEDKGVKLSVRVVAGPRIETILLDASKALRPHWVVLDTAFDNKRGLRLLEEGLDCSVFLVTKRKPVLVKLKQDYLGPNGDPPWTQLDNIRVMESSPSRISNSGTTQSPAWRSVRSFRSVRSTTLTAVNVQNSSTRRAMGNNNVACLNCFCHGKNATAVEDGPRESVSVLYTETPRISAAYLTNAGSPSPSYSADVRSPSSSPNVSRRIFHIGVAAIHSSRAIKRTAKKIEQRLEAAIKMATDDDDDPSYQMLM